MSSQLLGTPQSSFAFTAALTSAACSCCAKTGGTSTSSKKGMRSNCAAVARLWGSTAKHSRMTCTASAGSCLSLHTSTRLCKGVRISNRCTMCMW